MCNVHLLQKEVEDLQLFKDMFFENHPTQSGKERDGIILTRKDELTAKFEAIDGKVNLDSICFCLPNKQKTLFN